MSTAHDAPYKLAQALTRQQERTATLLVPTLPEKLKRLNPAERHEVTRIIRSMKLRKVIKRVLAEAFWARETARIQEAVTSMRQLRQTERTRASLLNYERSLIASDDAQEFVLNVARSAAPQLIEVPR